MKAISPATFLQTDAGEKSVLLDVRTPSEFEEGHLVHAVNLPLFDDQERAIIGTLYKQKGKQSAILEGLKITGPKMEPLVRQALHFANGNLISLYCWRGGMRSNSVGWLLQTAGLKVQVIEGGYKALRAEMTKFIQTTPWKIILLGGPTGSGKTHILHRLEKEGQQVIDLEGLAHHKGSAFGWIGEEEQPTNAQFLHELYTRLRPFDPRLPIWVEAESITIGKVRIPPVFWEHMLRAPRVDISVPNDTRLDQLVMDYGQFPKEHLIHAFSRIQKRLGGKAFKEATEAVLRGDLKKAAQLALWYYDKTYAYARQKANNPTLGSIQYKEGWSEIDLSPLIDLASKNNTTQDV